MLECPQGLLNKHYEKLIQCDVRLNCLSQQPEIVLDSPSFAPQGADPNDESRGLAFSHLDTVKGSPISGLHDVASPSVSQSSSSFKIEQYDNIGISSQGVSKEAHSPSSGTLIMFRICLNLVIVGLFIVHIDKKKIACINVL